MTQSGETPGGDDEQLRYLQEILSTLDGTLGGGSDLDRVLPETLETMENEEAREMLRSSDYEGVPIPYAFQYIFAVGDWLERLDDEGSTPELVTEITTGIGIREARYPGAPAWDRSRAHIGEAFLTAGDFDSALDMLVGMHSKHELARAALKISDAAAEDEHPERVMDAIIDRFSEEPDAKNINEFMQALYDEMVRFDPGNPVLDIYEEVLRAQDPAYDSLRSWAASMANDEPELDWNDIASLIEVDELWTDEVPLRFRQFVMASYADRIHGLSTRGATDEYVEDMIGELRAMERMAPDAVIWDRLRHVYGSLLAREYPKCALSLGRTMRHARFQRALVDDLIEHGAEDDALRLTTDMSDAESMAEALLDANWPEDQGIKRLTAILENDRYPSNRRMGCLLVVRDRMAEAGNYDKAAYYDALITALRSRMDEHQRRLDGE